MPRLGHMSSSPEDSRIKSASATHSHCSVRENTVGANGWCISAQKNRVSFKSPGWGDQLHVGSIAFVHNELSVLFIHLC